MSFPEIPKEKGTLKIPVEEIIINRDPPPYIPRTITVLPFDIPSRPALLFDLNGVLCASWRDCPTENCYAPNLETAAFDLVNEKDRHNKNTDRLTEALNCFCYFFVYCVHAH